MTFEIKPDGEVEFVCKQCEKTATARALKSLPKKWVVTGVLRVAVDPEVDRAEDMAAKQREMDERMHEAGTLIGAHFCSVKCAKEMLLSDKVKAQVERAGVTLAIYGKCELIIDGANARELGVPRADGGEGHRKGEIPPLTFDGGSPI